MTARRQQRLSRIRERLLAALVAAAALFALPAAHGLGFHHADHAGSWIASEPASPQLAPSATGASSEPSCPLCLASGQARAEALTPHGTAATHPPVVDPLWTGSTSALMPPAAGVLVAGPRAPPHA